MQPFADHIAGEITAALKRLLDGKHLYQCVDVNLSGINEENAEEVRKRFQVHLSTTGPNMRKPTVEEVIESGKQHAKKKWIPMEGQMTEAGCQRYGPAPTVTIQGPQYVPFEIPSIQTYCSHCEEAWPFNHFGKALTVGDGQDQWFCLGYQCQKCKRLPVWFMVRRKGVKLILVGRDPIEALPTPEELPKSVSKYYGDAQIAHHAGQTLAGIFLLRTFIEQFWRTLPEVKQAIAAQPRTTGDQQGDIYQAGLPEKFKEQFPSLKDIYGRLSAAMHEAKPDALLFENSCVRVVKHFVARKLLDL